MDFAGLNYYPVSNSDLLMVELSEPAKSWSQNQQLINGTSNVQFRCSKVLNQIFSKNSFKMAIWAPRKLQNVSKPKTEMFWLKTRNKYLTYYEIRFCSTQDLHSQVHCKRVINTIFLRHLLPRSMSLHYCWRQPRIIIIKFLR